MTGLTFRDVVLIADDEEMRFRGVAGAVGVVSGIVPPRDGESPTMFAVSIEGRDTGMFHRRHLIATGERRPPDHFRSGATVRVPAKYGPIIDSPESDGRKSPPDERLSGLPEA